MVAVAFYAIVSLPQGCDGHPQTILNKPVEVDFGAVGTGTWGSPAEKNQQLTVRGSWDIYSQRDRASGSYPSFPE